MFKRIGLTIFGLFPKSLGGFPILKPRSPEHKAPESSLGKYSFWSEWPGVCEARDGLPFFPS